MKHEKMNQNMKNIFGFGKYAIFLCNFWLGILQISVILPSSEDYRESPTKFIKLKHKIGRMLLNFHNNCKINVESGVVNEILLSNATYCKF